MTYLLPLPGPHCTAGWTEPLRRYCLELPQYQSQKASQNDFILNNAHSIGLAKLFTRMENPTVWFTIRGKLPETCRTSTVNLAQSPTHSQPMLPTVQPPRPSSVSADSPSIDHSPSQPPETDHLPSTGRTSTADQTIVPHLPAFQPISEPGFVWGTTDSASFAHSLDAAYHEITHWVRNSFKVPRSSAGKAFVNELTKLFRSVGEG